LRKHLQSGHASHAEPIKPQNIELPEFYAKKETIHTNQHHAIDFKGRPPGLSTGIVGHFVHAAAIS
jgi:hypothetical protein